MQDKITGQKVSLSSANVSGVLPVTSYHCFAVPVAKCDEKKSCFSGNDFREGFFIFDAEENASLRPEKITVFS